METEMEKGMVEKEVTLKCIQRIAVVIMEWGCLCFRRRYSQNGLCGLERVFSSPVSDSAHSISARG